MVFNEFEIEKATGLFFSKDPPWLLLFYLLYLFKNSFFNDRPFLHHKDAFSDNIL
jgi:hypothetical protein